jgi:hypothetical protein
MMNLKLGRVVAGICFPGLLMMASNHITAQSLISGPGCVTPGTTYEYVISCKTAPTAVMRVCITGGKLTNGKTCGPTGTIPNVILVVWDSSAIVRKIAVMTGLRTDSVLVTGTVGLNGGVVDDSDKVKSFSNAQSVYTFHCSEAIGGSCTPNYIYQWQMSQDGLNWANVDGAVNKDLQYTGTITGSTFFRRITTESQSNTIAYSDWARLDIVYGSVSN